MTQNNDRARNENRPDGTRRPDTADDGPVQSRKSPDGASPDRQVAQERQQSTGLGGGQS